MHAPPRGLSQLATSFIATQAKSSTIRRRCISDEYNIPADACANPMHGLIALPTVRARALALHIESYDPMLHLTCVVLYLDTPRCSAWP